MPFQSFRNAAGKEFTMIRKGNPPDARDSWDPDVWRTWNPDIFRPREVEDLEKEGWTKSEFPYFLHIDERKAEEQTASITLRNQIESPLLRLPAELRNEIYKYIFTTDGTDPYKWGSDGSDGSYPPDHPIHDLYGRSQYALGLSFLALKQQSLGLLAASRQLRYEGEPLLLSEVKIPETCSQIQRLFDLCKERELNGIRHVYVVLSSSDFRKDWDWDDDGEHREYLTWSKHSGWTELLNRCAGLKEITIEWLNNDYHDEDLDFDVVYALVEEAFRSDKQDPNMAITWYW